MSDLAARATSGAIWTYASYATGRLLVFFGMAAVARLLRPDDYGLFNMAAVSINLLEGSYDLGLRRGLIYFGNSVRGWSLQQTGFLLSVAIGSVLTATLFVLGPLAASFYGEPRVAGMMQVLSVYFGIACLGVVPDALLQHRLAFNLRFWPTIAAPASRYAIAIPLAAAGFGAWSLAWGQLIGVTLEVLLLVVLAGWRPRLGWSEAAAMQLFRYSSQVSLVEWTAAIGLNLDYVLVGHFLGTAVLGLYTLAFKLPDTTLGAAGWVGSRVLMPALVELRDQEQSAAETFLHGIRLVVGLLAPLAAGLYLLSPQIVPVLFGQQWVAAVPVVQLLVLSACLSGILQVVGAAFMAAGQPRKIAIAQAAWLAVLVPVLYIAAQRSIIAVAMAHLAAMLVFVGVKVAFIPSTLRVPLVDIARALHPALLGTGAMLVALVPATRLSMPGVLPLQVIVAIATYTLVLRWITIRRRRSRSGAVPRQLYVTMLMQSYFPRIGGAETNLQALVEPLRHIHVEVDIVTRRFKGMAPSECVDGARVVRVPVPGGQVRASLTFTLLSIWLLLRTRRLPDVLHAHELRSPTLAAVGAGLLTGRPVVAHVLRGGLLGDIRVLSAAPFGKARLWLFRHAVDRFVAVSRETQHELLSVGVPQRKIALMEYGVDTQRFRPASAPNRCALRQQLALEGSKVVLVVARLVAEKRFDVLLDAWPLVKAGVPSALLVIVGDGPERARLQRQAMNLESVRFAGELRDPVPYLQAADCWTLPSATEGQPISLLEAMSTGLACVGTNIGGISDALDDGRLGVLVPAGDVACLAKALIHLLRLSETERDTLGAIARQKIIERHSIEANASRLRRLYEELSCG